MSDRKSRVPGLQHDIAESRTCAGWHGQTRLPVGSWRGHLALVLRGEGILPSLFGARAHCAAARRGQGFPNAIYRVWGPQDGLATQGRDALATVRPNRSSTVKRVWWCHPESHRQSSLLVTCAVWMLLAGGCERTATTSQPFTQAAQVDHATSVAKELPKPSAQAPLLLEDEPADGTANGPSADNSRCFVCHVNYMQEEIAVTHAKAGISCAKCHGASDAHIADESWASGGNGTAPDIMYTRNKIDLSCMACHPKDKIDTPQHQEVLADTPGEKVCTDCHGKHRLPQRRCKWK